MHTHQVLSQTLKSRESPWLWIRFCTASLQSFSSNEPLLETKLTTFSYWNLFKLNHSQLQRHLFLPKKDYLNIHFSNTAHFILKSLSIWMKLPLPVFNTALECLLTPQSKDKGLQEPIPPAVTATTALLQFFILRCSGEEKFFQIKSQC